MAKEKRIGRNAFVEDLLGKKEEKGEEPEVLKPKMAKKRIHCRYRLPADLARRAKSYAMAHAMRPSEVVEVALEEFFAKRIAEASI